MVEDILVMERARTARELAPVLRDEGMQVLATYWDYDSERESWKLKVVLPETMPLRDFILRMIDLDRAGRLPSGLEAGEISQTGADDPRARALVRYAVLSRHKLPHIREALLDRAYFDEAVLGYVSPEFEHLPSA